jgi:hypothetical protein
MPNRQTQGSNYIPSTYPDYRTLGLSPSPRHRPSPRPRPSPSPSRRPSRSPSRSPSRRRNSDSPFRPVKPYLVLPGDEPLITDTNTEKYTSNSRSSRSSRSHKPPISGGKSRRVFRRKMTSRRRQRRSTRSKHKH